MGQTRADHTRADLSTFSSEETAELMTVITNENQNITSPCRLVLTRGVMEAIEMG